MLSLCVARRTLSYDRSFNAVTDSTDSVRESQKSTTKVVEALMSDQQWGKADELMETLARGDPAEAKRLSKKIAERAQIPATNCTQLHFGIIAWRMDQAVLVPKRPICSFLPRQAIGHRTKRKKQGRLHFQRFRHSLVSR